MSEWVGLPVCEFSTFQCWSQALCERYRRLIYWTQVALVHSLLVALF